MPPKSEEMFSSQQSVLLSPIVTGGVCRFNSVENDNSVTYLLSTHSVVVVSLNCVTVNHPDCQCVVRQNSLPLTCENLRHWNALSIHHVCFCLIHRLLKLPQTSPYFRLFHYSPRQPWITWAYYSLSRKCFFAELFSYYLHKTNTMLIYLTVICQIITHIFKLIINLFLGKNMIIVCDMKVRYHP